MLQCGWVKYVIRGRWWCIRHKNHVPNLGSFIKKPKHNTPLLFNTPQKALDYLTSHCGGSHYLTISEWMAK